jgi:hypothetical protein
MNETEWQKQVLKTAHTLGWHSMHIGRTGKHQAVGAKGTLGTGWPDLVLVKGGRMVIAELKTDASYLTEEQKRVISVLYGVPGIEVHIWRPADFGLIIDTLAV